MSEILETGAIYVCGFCFSSKAAHVLLIRKKRPIWQAGRLNGVGGKIENGETGINAMVREFQEETGASVSAEYWEYFALLEDKRGWSVMFFRSFMLDALELRETCATNDERLEPVFVDGIKRRSDVIENLKWLIPMALTSEPLRFQVVEAEL